MNIYLNDAFERGSTRFYFSHSNNDKRGKEEVVSVKPVKGMALVFMQPNNRDFLHDGEVVEGGFKYLLRTDIMYERVM